MPDTATSSGLELLLAALDADRDAAGEKYEVLRQKIGKILRWKGVPESRSDELVDETLDRLSEKLIGGDIIRDVNAYAAGVVRFVFLEYSRKNLVDAVGDDLPEVAVDPAQFDTEDERMACLRKCLVEIAPSEKDRDLIVSYYDTENLEKIKNNRRDLASRLGMTANALKVRACRLRAKLEQCIEDCMAGVTKTPRSDTSNRGGEL